jgi:hypothetical protein
MKKERVGCRAMGNGADLFSVAVVGKEERRWLRLLGGDMDGDEELAQDQNRQTKANQPRPVNGPQNHLV